MLLVMTCWVLAMISGLCWERMWTGILTAMTVVAFVSTHPSALTQWLGWMQLGVVGVSPWLLASQRGHDLQCLKQLHAKEAKKMARLSESARALLSLHANTQALETQITEITDVYHVTKATVRTLHLSELFASLLEVAPRLLNARGLRLVDLTAAPAQVLRALQAADGRLVLSPEEKKSSDEPAAHPVLSKMEQTIAGSALASTRSSDDGTPRTLSTGLPTGLSRVSWVPLWQEQRPIGVLVADELPDAQMKMLSLVANQLSLQLSRIHLYGQVEALAVTDALTGLSVRRYFLERAKEELERSKRHQLSCTVLMTDLDHFKEKNDTYGHLVGDVVLRDVAALLKRNLREIDLIARFGGEEFILLLIETQIDQAMPIAQRLKQLVEVHPIRAYDELLTQTLSIGAAGFPEHGQTLEELIERADQALYAAKHAGRNRVVRWSAPSVSPTRG